MKIIFTFVPLNSGGSFQQRMYGNIFYDRGGECVKWREEHLILATKDTMVVVVSDIHNFFITLA